MKKISSILFTILILSFPVHATTYNMCLGGDSIGLGVYGTLGGPMVKLSTLNGLTYTNQAVSGSCMMTSIAGVSGWLSTYSPSRFYEQHGINDIRCAVSGGCGLCTTIDTLNQWLTDYGTINTAVKNTGATLYPFEITPDCSETYYTAYNFSNTIKLWNPQLEDFSYTNNLPMVPSFLEMSDPAKDDCLLPAYNSQADGLHPGAAGDVVYGYLAYHAAIPTRSRDWGNSSYPNFGHESWSWWLLSGTASIVGGSSDSTTGHLNGGVLTLANGDSAVSDVVSFLPNSNNIAITLTTAQGTPVISYRTSTSNFVRSSGTAGSYGTVNNGAWTTYTGAFSLTAGTTQFIQIKIANASATQLQVSQAKLNWNVAPTYTISGTVSGAVQSGVTVACTGQTSTTTAGDGTYSFAGLSAGSYTITPSKTGYTFSPTSGNVTITTGNGTQNFTASAVTTGTSYYSGSLSGVSIK